MAREKGEKLGATKSTSQSASQSASRGAIWAILIILGFLVVIFIVVVASNGSIRANVINGKSCGEVQVPYEDQEEYIKTEYYTETVPYTDRECESKVLVYNTRAFNLVSSICNQRVEECIDYILGFCTKKIAYCTDRTIICSLTINNLDDERGIWSADFGFFKAGTSDSGVTDSESTYIEPHSSGTITASGRITTKELYDTTYTCNYVFKSEPTKQVCRDVTKYQDVQRERQVTAYRPVTKYKTEQQCN